MGKADRYQKLYPVTWDQLHLDAKALAWRLLEQGPFKGIIGVARGGLVPAAIVARELNIRLVDTLCICTYQGREQTGGEEVLKAIEGDGDGWLVVDDLVDTGNTATIIRIPGYYHGTGDVFASALLSGLLNNFNLERSAEIAVRFTAESILRTFKAQTDYRFGVNFEQSIPDLLKELKLI